MAKITSALGLIMLAIDGRKNLNHVTVKGTMQFP
jgi:hypothetical protein